jgi:AcrR family transcriptional regulator
VLVEVLDHQSEPSGWDRRRERVSREIERAALGLFAATNPEEVTIEQIAAAAGISNRTFFRYFASRDDILVGVPRRALAGLSERVRARPSSESVIEAFAAAGQGGHDPDEAELVYLWGIVVTRAPEAAARAFGHSAVGMVGVFQELIAERLGLDAESPRAGVLAAAIAGVVSFTYMAWLEEDGRMPLGKKLAEAFDALNDLRLAQR